MALVESSHRRNLPPVTCLQNSARCIKETPADAAGHGALAPWAPPAHRRPIKGAASRPRVLHRAAKQLRAEPAPADAAEQPCSVAATLNEVAGRLRSEVRGAESLRKDLQEVRGQLRRVESEQQLFVGEAAWGEISELHRRLRASEQRCESLRLEVQQQQQHSKVQVEQACSQLQAMREKHIQKVRKLTESQQQNHDLVTALQQKLHLYEPPQPAIRSQPGSRLGSKPLAQSSRAPATDSLDAPENWGITMTQLSSLHDEVIEGLETYSSCHELFWNSGVCTHVCRESPCSFSGDHRGVPVLARSDLPAGTTTQECSANMHLVVDRVVKPFTKGKKKSFALAKNPNGLRISVFVTHTWNELFRHFVGTLRMALEPDEAVWVCSFALPQNGDIKGMLSSSDLSQSPFAVALHSAQKYIVVMDKSLEVPDRAWCTYEMDRAIQWGIPTMIWPYNFEDLPRLQSKVLDLDTKNAKATDDDDLQRIREAIMASGGYDRLNRHLRDFMTDRLKFYEHAKKLQASKVDMLRRQLNDAIEEGDQAKIEKMQLAVQLEEKMALSKMQRDADTEAALVDSVRAHEKLDRHLRNSRLEHLDFPLSMARARSANDAGRVSIFTGELTKRSLEEEEVLIDAQSAMEHERHALEHERLRREQLESSRDELNSQLQTLSATHSDLQSEQHQLIEAVKALTWERDCAYKFGPLREEKAPALSMMLLFGALEDALCGASTAAEESELNGICRRIRQNVEMRFGRLLHNQREDVEKILNEVLLPTSVVKSLCLPEFTIAHQCHDDGVNDSLELTSTKVEDCSRGHTTRIEELSKLLDDGAPSDAQAEAWERERRESSLRLEVLGDCEAEIRRLARGWRQRLEEERVSYAMLKQTLTTQAEDLRTELEDVRQSCAKAVGSFNNLRSELASTSAQHGALAAARAEAEEALVEQKLRRAHDVEEAQAEGLSLRQGLESMLEEARAEKNLAETELCAEHERLLAKERECKEWMQKALRQASIDATPQRALEALCQALGQAVVHEDLANNSLWSRYVGEALLSNIASFSKIKSDDVRRALHGNQVSATFRAHFLGPQLSVGLGAGT